MNTIHKPLPGIDRYQPSTWEEITGNHQPKQHFREQLSALSTGKIDKGRNTLLEGLSRSGKTVVVRFFAQCLLCTQLCMKTLNPGCGGQCENCRNRTAGYAGEGIFSHLQEHFFHFRTIDCMKIGGVQELRDEIKIMNDYHGVKVVYLDEVTRLEKPVLAEVLLAPMNDLNYMWIASGISAKGLDEAFLNRFSERLTTELPTLCELAEWLTNRCLSWEIDWDHEDTIVRLAERSNLIPGLALQPLSKVNFKPDRKLTREIVENFRFTATGP